MKKNKTLHRAWLWGYVFLVFGGALAPLMAFGISDVFSYLLYGVLGLVLADLIVAHVFYAKKRNLFPLLSFIGHGVLSALILFAYIVEIVNTANGKPAVYPWVVGSICLLGMIYVNWRVIGVNRKIIRGEVIIEGKQ